MANARKRRNLCVVSAAVKAFIQVCVSIQNTMSWLKIPVLLVLSAHQNFVHCSKASLPLYWLILFLLFPSKSGCLICNCIYHHSYKGGQCYYPIYKLRTWGTNKNSGTPEITQEVCGRTGSWTLVIQVRGWRLELSSLMEDWKYFLKFNILRGIWCSLW